MPPPAGFRLASDRGRRSIITANPADVPVLVLALTSDTMPLHGITEYAATAIVPRLSEVAASAR